MSYEISCENITRDLPVTSENGRTSHLENYFKVSLEEELKRFPRIRTLDIAEVRQWLTTQPHLPHIPDILIAHFLHTSSYEVEVAKRSVKLHCEYKSAFTEFFDDWDPLSKDLRDIYTHVCRVGFLPNQLFSQPRIMLVQLKADSAEMYNFGTYTKWLFISVMSLVFHEGLQEEFKVVTDSMNFTFSHFRKTPASLVRNYQKYMEEGTTATVTAIHHVNCNFAIRNMLSIIKLFLNERTQKTLHFHGEPEEFFKAYPAEVVPQDYGGTGPSIQTLHDENTTRVLSSRRALMEFCSLKAIY